MNFVSILENWDEELVKIVVMNIKYGIMLLRDKIV